MARAMAPLSVRFHGAALEVHVVTFIGIMIAVLALATVAMIVAGVVLGVQALTLYGHAMSMRDALMSKASGSRDLFTRIASRGSGVKDTLALEWQRVRPRVDEVKHDAQRALMYWKRSAREATTVARKTSQDVRIVRAAGM